MCEQAVCRAGATLLGKPSPLDWLGALTSVLGSALAAWLTH